MRIADDGSDECCCTGWICNFNPANANSEMKLPRCCIEDHHDVLKASVVAAVGIELHTDQSGRLAGPTFKKCRLACTPQRVHMEKAGAAADAQKFAEGVARMRNVEAEVSARIGQQRLHNRPVALVLARDGKPVPQLLD